MKSHKHDISEVVEDLKCAYQEMAGHSGSMNTDYAGFACMALEDFRKALNKPELTCEDLQAMIRDGMREHRIDEKADGNWAKLVSSHIRRTANESTSS